MNLHNIYDKALNRERLTKDEALALWHAPLPELAAAADMLRCKSVDNPTVVTWQIDRNVNITNVCISGCRFCNFHCKPHQVERHFITTLEEWRPATAARRATPCTRHRLLRRAIPNSHGAISDTAAQRSRSTRGCSHSSHKRHYNPRSFGASASCRSYIITRSRSRDFG